MRVARVGTFAIYLSKLDTNYMRVVKKRNSRTRAEQVSNLSTRTAWVPCFV